MDKSRNMRRGGASRFSHAKRQIMKQSGMDGKNTVFSEKLKKERMRRLSVVGRVISSKDNREMGCGGSDDEDALPPPTTSISKKVKLPRKFFHDCNTVDHASVPRKLRSAMKKRNRESVSPPLLGEKQPNHGTDGVKLPRKDGMKKSRMKIQERDSEGYSSLPSVVGPITKDEEEVVETLYALAVMFPNINKKNGMDGESAKPKSSPFPERESSRPAFEESAAAEKEEESKSLRPSTTADATNPSLLDASAQETVEVKCAIDPSQPDFPRNKKLHSELENSISRSDGQAVSLLSNSEPIDGNPARNYVICNVQSQLGLETGSKLLKHEEAAVCARKPEIAAAAFNSQHGLQHTLKESKEGSALWPGLSSARSHCAGTQGSSSQSSRTKFPTWLSTAASATQTGSLDDGVLTDKDCRAPIAQKNSWKRCSAHVYICHLIKVLQAPEKTGSSPMQPTELTPNEGPQQGILLAANHLKGVRNCLNRAVSAGCAAEQNPNEVRNAILLHRRLFQDQQQASATSVLDTSQMQSSDFLSLSAGGGGMEATSGTNKAGNGLEQWTRLCNPYLQSLVQNHTIMPFSLPQNRFSSTPFTDHIPESSNKQVQIQPPPYLNSPILGPPHLAYTAFPKQQQQQQWIWTAQCKSMGLAASHIPNWQNDRPDLSSSSSAVQYAQPIPQLSHTSLEVLGPKYAPFSHQQQLFAAASSLPTARAKKQHHHFPTGYEGNGASSFPETALPLELLCNEHL